MTKTNVTEKKNKFNFNCKAVILTYKEHIEIKKFKFLCENENTHKLIYETGSTGYVHCHLLIMFKKKIHTRDCRFFDIGNIHPNIKKVCTKKHWCNAAKYEEASKKEGTIYKISSDTLTGNEYVWLGSVRDIIQSCKTWNDVVNHENEYLEGVLQKYLNWAREVFKAKPRPNLTKDAVLRAWQNQLVKQLSKQNDRKIKWVYDPTGGNGKSFLTNFLLDNKNAFFCNNGKLSDVAYAYNNEPLVIFDLPRSTVDTDGKDWTPYRCMECFKDGRLFSSKYQSCIKRFKSCAVVVFANFLPDRSKLSADRWDVVDLNTGTLSAHKFGLVPGVLNIRGTPDLVKEPVQKKRKLNKSGEGQLPSVGGCFAPACGCAFTSRLLTHKNLNPNVLKKKINKDNLSSDSDSDGNTFTIPIIYEN